MRRIIASIVAVLSLVLGAVAFSTPANALPNLELAHWSYFKWAGSSLQGRAFYVYDRTGDPTVHAALQDAINDFHNDLNARGAWVIVPAPVYVLDDGHLGQCDSTPFSAGSGFNFAGYSFITVCSGGPGNGTSVTWAGGSGSHDAENYHPSIHVQREYPDYATTYSSLMHELLHAEGLGHTNDCSDLMGGSEYGCRLTPGVVKKPSPADYDALTNFYFNHPMSS